ncbi:MAG: hypothetical protein Q8L55_15455 [Phycisphaerales bacterium]|nr:hypothetical protein [Phycisphaerales bacterium]
MRLFRRLDRPKPISRRPRLRRLRRWSVNLAAVIVAVVLASWLSGYELIWARGHEAAVFTRGTVVYYRSGYDIVYCLRRSATAGDGKQILWNPTPADGLCGRTLSQLSWASATSRQSMPGYYPDGLAINAAPSIAPQAEMFDRRNNLWRSRLPLWWAVPAVLIPWCAAVVWLRLKLPLARRAFRVRHRCRGCGYSMIGLPTGAPCPECGRAP